MHVMLDLETWGTKPGCAIRSVGAVVFDPHTGGLMQEFYANISDISCEAWGLVKEPATEAWWGDQGTDAQSALLVDRRPLHDVLVDFSDWWVKAHGEQVYGMGANFDPPIIEAAFVACDIEIPWKFWNVRCARTILAMANRRPERVGREVAHHSLHDSKAQARAVAAAFRHGQFSAN